jgi:hypothetical protein
VRRLVNEKWQTDYDAVASGGLTNLVHEVLDVVDIGVAVASALAASSTVYTKKCCCGILAKRNSGHTTSVCNISAAIRIGSNRELT